MRLHFLRTAGFVLVPSLSLLSSLLVLPLISAKYGGAGWAAVTLGQSIGAIIGVIVGLSWPIVGGHRIASADSEEQRVNIYVLSHYSRLWVLLATAPIGCILSFYLSQSLGLETILFCIGTAFNGLTASWYFAGTGNPRPLIINEGVVRLSVYGFAILGLSFGLGLWFYALLYALSGLVMVFLNWRTVVRRKAIYDRPQAHQIRQLVRQQLFGTTSRLIQAAFTFGGPAIIAGARPSELAAFSGYDQLQKSGTGAASAVTSSLVNLSSGTSKTRFGSRSGVAMLICCIGSVLFALLWFFAGSHIVRYVFAGELKPSSLSILLVGSNICLLFLLKSFELLVLVPRGLADAVYRGNLWASVVGIGALVFGVLTLGTNGALAASCIYSIFALTLHFIALKKRNRSLSPDSGGSDATGSSSLNKSNDCQGG